MTQELPAIDYGKAEINAFADMARGGDFKYDADGIRQIVEAYGMFIEEIMEVSNSLDVVVRGCNFGGFPSAQELREGFSWKAKEGKHVLDQLIDGIYRIQEAYLLAANQIEDADVINQRRLTHTTEMLGDAS